MDERQNALLECARAALRISKEIDVPVDRLLAGAVAYMEARDAQKDKRLEASNKKA